MLLRHGLKARGLEFRLYYPKPRSAASAATDKYAENRITFRPHFYFGETNQEIDFVFFLNGLPVVALELKHEKNQTVYDANPRFRHRLSSDPASRRRPCLDGWFRSLRSIGDLHPLNAYHYSTHQARWLTTAPAPRFKCGGAP
jgi:hypothetical protein